MKAMTSWLVSAICAALLISAVAASDITIKDVTVALLEGSGTEVSSRVLSGPNSEKLGVLDHTRTLKVRLTAALASAPEENFRPQQVFLRLTSRDTAAAAYFAAVKANDGTLYATAKSADIQKQIGVQAGVYDAALIVGDTRSAEPLLWGLGEANVLHPPLDDGSQPAAAPYRTVDREFQPLPEIRHMHRAPERRAPAAVSLFFALLAAAPVALYVVVALQLGANLKGFPSGAGFLAAAGFHAGLLAILALYLLFWLKLNMMQTIPALALLAAGTAAAGSSALNQLAATKQE